jgi:cell division protein FtsL
MRIAKVFYIQAVLTALALCVVWQGSLARQTGYRQELLTRAIERYEAEVQEHSAQISRLSSPQRILYLINYLALDLTHEAANPRSAVADRPVGSGSGYDGPPDEVASLNASH